jgi:tetratricopeptide (TPR) repeat protein
MEQSEEKELNSITNEFAKGMEAFKKQECRDASDIFNGIIENYKDSEYYSVLEIQTRSKVYKRICEARHNPPKVPLDQDKDYLFDGIYNLNAGKLDMALERFEYLKNKGNNDPYLYYLLSLLYLKKEDHDTCLDYLKKAIQLDATYKVIAHNEPDFDPLFENESFVALISIEQE